METRASFRRRVREDGDESFRHRIVLKVSDEYLLYGASNAGDAVRVRSLIAAGADVNCQDDEGNTPFSAALQTYDPFAVIPKAAPRPSIRDRRRVLKILLRAGANVHTGSVQRRTETSGAWALVDAIREAGGWANYVARYQPTAFASVVKKAITHGLLPHGVNLEIASFMVPPGGYY